MAELDQNIVHESLTLLGELLGGQSKGHYPRLIELLRNLGHHDLVPRIKALAE